MWHVLIDHFRRYPAQERMVRLMISHGMRITDGKVHSGAVEVADTSLARAAGADRRIVRSTIRTIMADDRLRSVFTRLQPTLHLKEVAPLLGCGVIEIIPEDASRPGILAGVSKIIAEAGLNIRQAIVEDPEFSDQPRLHVVTEEPLPLHVIPLLRAVAGVRGVTVY